MEDNRDDRGTLGLADSVAGVSGGDLDGRSRFAIGERVQKWVDETLTVPAIRWTWIVLNLALSVYSAQLAGNTASQVLRFRTRRLNKSTAEPRRVLVWFLSAAAG